jgi:hypothetical protein
MDEHIYREQLIRVITMQTPGTEFWVAKADVRYNDNKRLQFFPVEGPRDQFTSKEEAEVNILEQARKLIDKLSCNKPNNNNPVGIIWSPHFLRLRSGRACCDDLSDSADLFSPAQKLSLPPSR